MNNRNVVVAMPFGERGLERRRAILNFRRLKYIIEEKCQVVPSPTTGMNVAYDVNVAKAVIKDIPSQALSQINEADILIALLSERNFTVTYELGYRRGRDRTPVILIVDSPDDIPVYESAVAYQEWRQDEVLEEIDRIARNDFPKLVDYQGEIPPSLKEVIDAKDEGLVNSLRVTLQEIENDHAVSALSPAQKLRSILSDGEITRYYPFSVVEIRFAKRGVFEESESPTEVVEFDEKFSRLYGYVDKASALKDGPLTLDRLLERLEKFSDTDDWQEFLQEQVTLTDTVIKDLGFAIATIPIKINSSHTDEFRGRAFLPCITSQVIDGDRDGPHNMYLLIAYIDVTNTHLATRSE